ncbi:MAG: zinc-dependent alcohol dehydrogenase [Saccharofermentanales bacterium]|jgi:2-desacetyl-2-hydroxyethyl bacteriochlorophyllide A dehydrogenase
MRIVNLYDKEDLRIEDVKKPECNSGFALIKMIKCGICGSDVNAYLKTNPTVNYPIIGLGHEGIGEIEELLDDDTDFKIGDRVVIEPYIPCMKCNMCKNERFNNCENLKVSGVHTNGVMSGYFLHPLKLIYKIPDKLTDSEACLVEPLTISLHALFRANVKAEENVVIFGAGTIGALASLAANAYGANVNIVDVNNKRLEYIKSLGIENIINSTQEDLIKTLRENCCGRLPSVMIDCTGSNAILENIHEYVEHGARVVWVGWPKKNIKLNQTKCMQKELSIFASRNSNNKFPEAINLLSNKIIPSVELITDEIKVDELETMFIDLIQNPSNHLKVVVNLKDLLN